LSDALRVRVITAAVLVASLLVVLFALPSAATLVLLTAVVLAGAWEWSGFLRTDSRLRRALFVALIAVLLPLAWRVTTGGSGRRVLLLGASFWWLCAFAWLSIAPQRVRPWSAALAGTCVLVPMWIALLRLRLVEPHGSALTLFALVLVWAADSGAYFAGRSFGRVKLAPRVSPGKTWEGVLGGMMLSALVAAGGVFALHVPAVPFVLVSIAAVAFSVVGDLTESMFKRYAGLKDSGWLIPGHGGVLDRIDSVTASAPVFLFGLLLTGVVA
jgi:phosphatidate cytidylyltransferase